MGHVYLSPEHAGETWAILAGGRYAEGPMIPVAKGVATRLSTAG